MGSDGSVRQGQHGNKSVFAAGWLVCCSKLITGINLVAERDGGGGRKKKRKKGRGRTVTLYKTVSFVYCSAAAWKTLPCLFTLRQIFPQLMRITHKRTLPLWLVPRAVAACGDSVEKWSTNEQKTNNFIQTRFVSNINIVFYVITKIPVQKIQFKYAPEDFPSRKLFFFKIKMIRTMLKLSNNFFPPKKHENRSFPQFLSIFLNFCQFLSNFPQFSSVFVNFCPIFVQFSSIFLSFCRIFVFSS